MNAHTRVEFDEYGGPEVLHLRERETSSPGEGQVRVRVSVAGIQQVDAKLRRGQFAAGKPATVSMTLGNEFSGVIDEVGAGVSTLVPGQAVLGFGSAIAYSESVIVPADQVITKPDGVSFEVAGALSGAGQTAANAVETLNVGPGDTLLIHAAAGGVGTLAIQLARMRGVSVIGTASEANHDYLRRLGAIPVVYGPGLIERVRDAATTGVDAALDLIGGPATEVSNELVADRQRIGTTVNDEAAARFGVHRLRGVRSTRLLQELVTLVADGKVILPITGVYEPVQAPEAHSVIDAGHVHGKIILNFSRSTPAADFR
ncbi:NADP-dependent oxidoreductase [Paenarthrobacter sp. PH39-S1]|uniref:NADP-dependent oxidoreductase n=1 Tax=Paenarthrobacter sp. PH39-S1 TaxID=3046204 RepID=UPI0024B9CDE5|nr:NADP-dependent oxidoreductase [Paenarthrobacter sp. PH39-S1]MDJ0356305.1 NADP-dependent oxidoreductase [Paenarthrobacter sp. PH39-S1]